MLTILTPGAFDALANGVAPIGLRLVQDSSIASQEVLRMLSDLNRGVDEEFSPSAWLIVEDGEVVGLCSITRPPENGDVHIGYACGRGKPASPSGSGRLRSRQR
ncbi:hypothetical protein GFB56_28590 [Ensifer sp. T173]|uniref:N-acetyltransferase domain-containing protein n=1 Tax=Ensifer canadensis TaxID=555315 RepID=A0AAW4FTP8_9HYPH|nr:hypothetical protein [Ensifer canadensis]MBM3094703.1 hypothetical protein [Ensifer canadensis]UBI79614.1 hypothetical protein J3R84_32285 [Ensifer canadensis]